MLKKKNTQKRGELSPNIVGVAFTGPLHALWHALCLHLQHGYPPSFSLTHAHAHTYECRELHDAQVINIWCSIHKYLRDIDIQLAILRYCHCHCQPLTNHSQLIKPACARVIYIYITIYITLCWGTWQVTAWVQEDRVVSVVENSDVIMFSYSTIAHCFHDLGVYWVVCTRYGPDRKTLCETLLTFIFAFKIETQSFCNSQGALPSLIFQSESVLNTTEWTGRFTSTRLHSRSYQFLNDDQMVRLMRWKKTNETDEVNLSDTTLKAQFTQRV
jgi:hypothetical protein